MLDMDFRESVFPRRRVNKNIKRGSELLHPSPPMGKSTPQLLIRTRPD
jgi:hypothetical protein